MSAKVFYAWQSDCDEKFCRFLIRDAARIAVKRLATQASVTEAPSLDHDTKDEPGTPHIADTILRKIKRCGVFLADLTMVSEYKTADGRTKKTPNPNVLIELGLAIRSIGWKRILLVMNDHFGGPDDLPFDLKHHSFPIQYTLSSAADKQRAKKELSDRLFGRLKVTFDSGVIEAAEQNRAVETSVQCKTGTGRRQHVRWLVVQLTNRRYSLNDVQVVLEVRTNGKVVEHRFQPVGGLPEPFAVGFSASFAIHNDNPALPLPSIANIPATNLAVVVRSRFKEVVRIPATRFEETLDDFRKMNMFMEQRPTAPMSVEMQDHIITCQPEW